MSDIPTADPTLNPCRLCGSGAYLFQTFYGKTHWDAACINYACMNRTDEDNTQKAVRRAWNKANPKPMSPGG